MYVHHLLFFRVEFKDRKISSVSSFGNLRNQKKGTLIKRKNTINLFRRVSTQSSGHSQKRPLHVHTKPNSTWHKCLPGNSL